MSVISADDLLHAATQREAKMSAVTGLVLEHLDAECQQLCSVDGFCSILCKHGKGDMMEFSFQAVIAEWKEYAPILFAFLKTVAGKV